jgi:septation ring formation regulator EzrA
MSLEKEDKCATSTEIKTHLQQIQTQLHEIQTHLGQTQIQLTELKENVIELKTQLNIISKNTDKMEDHISFVEDVYNVVKNPFQKVLSYYYGNNVQLTNPKRIE